MDGNRSIESLLKSLKRLFEGIRWGIFAVAILISIIFVSPTLKETTYFTEATTIEIASMISNFVLTFFLVVIYTQISDAEQAQAEESEHQREILETQKETQKEQQKLFKANHQPLIRELEWKPYEVNGNDGLYVHCINKGNGLAKNLQLKCEISIPKSVEEEGLLTIYTTPPDANDNINIPEAKASPLVKQHSEYSRGADGAVLSNNEGDRQFFSALEFSKVTYVSDSVRKEQPMSFEDVIEFLEEEGCEQYQLELSLIYENILGETESYSLFNCWGDTDIDFTSTIHEAKGESGTEEVI